MKRVAGVEPFYLPSGVPPAHGSTGVGVAAEPAEVTPITRETGAQVGVQVEQASAPVPPSEAFAKHFFRCFFCHVGDRYTEDHFCEDGRDLLVAMLDEIHDREFQR